MEVNMNPIINKVTLLTALSVLGGSYVYPIVSKNDELVSEQKIVSIYKNDHEKPNRFYFGPEVFWVHSQPHRKHAKLRDNGVYYGPRLGYELTALNNLYLGIEGLYAVGNADIRLKKNDIVIHKSKSFGYFANAEARAGYNISNENTKNFHLTPFLGIGGYWIKPSNNYVENWLYATGGLRFDFLWNDSFDFGLNLKAMRSLAYEQKVNFHKVHSHDHSNNWGYGIDVPLTWRLGETRQWNIQLDPYFLKLNCKSSENIWGGSLNVGYLF